MPPGVRGDASKDVFVADIETTDEDNGERYQEKLYQKTRDPRNVLAQSTK